MPMKFEKCDSSIKAHKIDGEREYLSIFHKQFELIYVVKGNLNISVDGKMKMLSPNQMSVGFPYSVHTLRKSPDTEAILVMFPPEIAPVFRHELSNFKPDDPFITDAEIFLPLLKNILLYASNDERLAICYLNVVIGEILRHIKLVKLHNVNMSYTQRVLVYCSEHYKENISIKTVASALYMSESYISKIFAYRLGHPFREYINMLRISEAKRLLNNTDMKITDIMYECGFTNQSSFNRIFFSETGLTPREYKEKNRKTT